MEGTGSPNPTGVGKTVPEQLDMQAFAKQNVKQANVNKLDQV